MTETITAGAHEANAGPVPVSETAREVLRSQPLLIPIPKAAKLLGISRSAAYRCAACGDLPTRHLGGRVYIVTAKLREFLESA